MNPVGLHELNPVGLHELNPVGLHELNPVGLHELNPVGLHELNPVGLHELNPVGLQPVFDAPRFTAHSSGRSGGQKGAAPRWGVGYKAKRNINKIRPGMSC